nr:hypothetical protein [Planctomycetota bacterium]
AVQGAVLAPADLLRAPEGEGSAELAWGGRRLALGAVSHRGGLAVLALDHETRQLARERLRAAAGPEDLVLIDGNQQTRVVAASRMQVQDGRWVLDPGLALDPAWHGVVACSLSDGTVIGLLALDESGAAVLPLSEKLLADLRD